MFNSKIASLALFMFSIAGSVASTPLIVNTPANAFAGEPVLITFSGGSPPFDVLTISTVLRVFSGVSNVVAEFNPVTGHSVTWDVNVSRGTAAEISVTDSVGAAAHSALFTIQ